MLDFPSAGLVVGQQYTAAGTTWVWDGAKWTTAGAGGGPFVPQAGFVPAMNDNRIINGDMRIDQRGVASGAGGTAVGAYTVDRWYYNATQASKGTWQRAAAGAQTQGFPYALQFTSSSAYTPLTSDFFQINQPIEADMVSDFQWGTANAQSVTLSFWVNCSLTGTFSGSVRNYSGSPARSYPFTFSLPVASTWTKIVITIPGDTTAGGWTMSGNGGALYVIFDLGSGSTYRAAANAWATGVYLGATGSVSVVATNGATFYVTGVKLEIGSVATPYNRQSLAKSMADCQRYYQVIAITDRMYFTVGGANRAANVSWYQMRSSPTAALISSVGGRSNVSTVTMSTYAPNSGQLSWVSTAAGDCYIFNDQWSLSAEL